MKPSTISDNFPDTPSKRNNASKARLLLERLSAHRAPATLMEVCGTHTVALFTTGVRAALPECVRVISGPGCPVCVTPLETIEKAIGFAHRKDTVLFCFGDMLRIPGVHETLESARAHRGARVKLMYSPLEAIEYARREPDQSLVLFGTGFETTIPIFASVLMRAREDNLRNIFLLSAFKSIPPAIKALLSAGDSAVDGFLLPGHVSSVIGVEPYGFIAGEYHLPGVIAGFEAADMIEGILLLLRMIDSRQPEIKNQYTRFVPPEGNPRARAMIDTVFVSRDTDWRGLGTIHNSGFALRDDFRRFDADQLMDFEIPPVQEPADCICGEVIRGRRTPVDCTLYGRSCTPSHPIGPCMVSSEGTCAAFYKYSR
ncbi:MAG: hydrogenase formation protein HypD [Candidatus Aureabacteria bacterium]|nr:hydrogenase formation protein HypD [Candidatus Auribacterota bacterium]